MASQSSEVVIVGGGIVGSSVAYYLAKAGVEVTLVERTGISSQASGANVGLVVQVTKEPSSVLYLLIAETLRILSDLDQELGCETEFARVGALNIYLTPETLEAGLQLASRQQAAGLDVRMLNPEEARAVEPALPPQTLGAAFCSTDGFVNPYKTTAAFAGAARKLGARVLCPVEVTGIEVRNGAVAAVETSQGKILTKTVVNAAGSWSPLVGQFVGLDIPVIPCRGQMLVTERVPKRVVTRVILGGEPSARQTQSGSILIGSTPQFVGYDKRNDHATVEQFARGVCEFFPFVRDLQIVRTWANLRPATKDNIPFLGRVKEVEGFVLATGHFRNGLAAGPASGKVIAELLTGRPTCVPIEGCGLDRPSARA